MSKISSVSVVAKPNQDDAAIVAAYERLAEEGRVLEEFEEASWLAALQRLEDAKLVEDLREEAAATETLAAKQRQQLLAEKAEARRQEGIVAKQAKEERLRQKGLEAFLDDRYEAAAELDKKSESEVADALRGESKSGWMPPSQAKGILRKFLAGITPASRFYDIAGEVLAAATKAASQEAADAKAKHCK